jgi:hypothetical protein
VFARSVEYRSLRQTGVQFSALTLGSILLHGIPDKPWAELHLSQLVLSSRRTHWSLAAWTRAPADGRKLRDRHHGLSPLAGRLLTGKYMSCRNPRP